MFSCNPRRDPIAEACVRCGTAVQTVDDGTSLEINSNSWGVYSGESAAISTGDLENSIGIGVFDPKTRLSVCGKFDAAAEGHTVSAMLDFIGALAQNSPDIRVAVSGVPVPNNTADQNPDLEAIRTLVVHGLKDLGLSENNFETVWAHRDIITMVDVLSAEETVEITEIARSGDYFVDF